MGRKRNGPDRKYNEPLIEEHFQRYIADLYHWLPEGMIEVDIDLLHRMDLLNYESRQDPALTRYFHVLESSEKITLLNNEFIIWIVPEADSIKPKTLVLIAINQEGIPHLELAFSTSDVYNSSKLVLRVLEKFLFEIEENEASLNPYREPLLENE